MPWETEPGTHAAFLEERKLGALADKELSKPPGQRDEELAHELVVKYRRKQLANAQAIAHSCAQFASMYEQPAAHQCCAGAGWVRQRMAASYHARHDYLSQQIQQWSEEVAAAEARRPAALVAQPTLRLNLPQALQHPPPRLDLCSACAGKVEEAERRELGYTVHAEHLRQRNQQRGLQPASVAARPGPAEVLPAGEPSQAWQQQQQGVAGGGGKEDEPATPAHRQPQQQQQEPQQHTSSEKGQEQHE